MIQTEGMIMIRMTSLFNGTRFGMMSVIALFAGVSFSACSGFTGADRQSADVFGSDRPGGLRELILAQPDFSATASLQFSQESAIKEIRGFSTSYGVLKLGSIYRLDRRVVISFERSDQPSLHFYPRSREYCETPRSGSWFENALNPGVARLSAPGMVFERIGDIEVDGHNCFKIQISNRDDASMRIIYYLAADLRNLVVKTEFIDLLGTTTFALKDISFDVSNDLFRLPSDYRKCAADPTAEYRLRDLFQIGDPEVLSPESFRSALLEKLPRGLEEEAIYRYLDERLAGKDRFSSYSRANDSGQILLRINQDPTLPMPVKKHFGVVFLLDEKEKLKDVQLNSWVTGP